MLLTLFSQQQMNIIMLFEGTIFKNDIQETRILKDLSIYINHINIKANFIKH